MKKSILLALLAVAFYGCGDEPQTTVRHHPASRGEKAPPNVSSQAEDFRAVEKPSTYSE